MRNNAFKLIFKDKDDRQIDLDYELHDSIVAEKWFKKIKHLRNIPIDEVESQQLDVGDLKTLYKEFCIFAGMEPIDFDIIDQSLLNDFHTLYEKTHNDLSKRDNNSILYKFHHCIHFHEKTEYKDLTIAWGTKEGPLTEQFVCNDYYEKRIEKNNIYLQWAELGKTPFRYWKDKEANDQNRINQLCKPHKTLRAMCFISYKDVIPKQLDTKFEKWFDHYKNNWLYYHDIKKWDEIDEYSSPLLATTQHKEDISNLKFLKILL